MSTTKCYRKAWKDVDQCEAHCWQPSSLARVIFWFGSMSSQSSSFLWGLCEFCDSLTPELFSYVSIVSIVQYPLSLSLVCRTLRSKMRKFESILPADANTLSWWTYDHILQVPWHTCFSWSIWVTAAICVAPRCTECHHNWKEDWELSIRMSCVEKDGALSGIMFGPEWFGCQYFPFQAVLA